MPPSPYFARAWAGLRARQPAARLIFIQRTSTIDNSADGPYIVRRGPDLITRVLNSTHSSMSLPTSWPGIDGLVVRVRGPLGQLLGKGYRGSALESRGGNSS
jgi:hypothetical protein